MSAWLTGLLVAGSLCGTASGSPLGIHRRQTPPANLTPITSCPAGNNRTIITNNLGYNLCLLSQYNVGSQSWPVVDDNVACAALCSRTSGCTTAVYDRGGRNCNIKGNPSTSTYNFLYDNRFDAIRLAYTPNQQADITACPFGGYVFNGPDGAVYDVCPMTDYPFWNPSVKVLPNVRTATACAALCLAKDKCVQAVFDNVEFYCHLKGDLGANPQWKVNSKFDSIRLRPQSGASSSSSSTTTTRASRTTTTTAAPSATPSNGTPINGACPSGASNYTEPTSGSSYSICPNSDYPTNGLQVIPNINKIADCVTLCDKAAQCTHAVFDHQYNYCHIKGALGSTPPFTYNSQFDTIRKISSGSSGAPITSAECPTGATGYTAQNGIQFGICPNSDYNVNNLVDVAAQSPSACAELCSTRPGCYYMVYEPGMCHLKGAPYQRNRQASNFYTTIFVIDNANNTKTMSTRNGQWGGVIPLQVNPVAAYLVPAFPTVRKFLTFASFSATTFDGGQHGNTMFGSYDIGSNTQGQMNIAQTNHDMFCPGINAMADGRLVIDGGNTDSAVTIYDPFSDSFSAGPKMTTGRGYQTSVTLSDGKTFTIGGSFTGGIGGQNGVPMKNGEVFDPKTNTWTALPGALVQNMLTTYDNAGAWRTDNHGWLYAWSGGSVLQAGPSKNMNWYGTSGRGSVQGAGQRNGDNDQMCGVNVMFDTGRIFSAGGAQSYSDTDSLPTAHLITIRGVNQNPSVQRLPNMYYARMYANVVVLPSGKVFITGGQTYAKGFSDVQSVLQSEIWDPATNTFTLVAPAAIPRNYHSSILLMPDGRVMSGGGGLCYVNGNCNDANHPDLQFYSPPYMFDANGNPAARPQVSSITSSSQSGDRVQVRPGGTLTVTLDSTSNLSHAIVRLGSATHSIDSDQRRIPLNVQSTSGNTVTLSIPGDNGIVPPGFWYYFAVAPSGVHSIGLTVNVMLS